MADLAIHTENLTKVYRGDLGKRPIVALDGLNCDVERGEVFAFIGPNGAGKTTTIKLLTRLLRPTNGRIFILGVENKSHNSMERVGYLPELPNMYGYLSGREFLDFIARIFKLDFKERKRRVSQLLERVGLEKSSDVAIRNYSRGMLQRLGLAQALINDPELLILDEPMSGLDPIGRKDFRDLILQLRDQGKTIFFSSHILSDAEMIADRVGILNKGRLINIGKLDDLTSSHITSVDVTFRVESDALSRVDTKKYKTVIRDQNVMVRLNDSKEVNELVKSIERWGGQIISVIPQRKSLEEIFMTEVGR